ncbi:MAG: LysR family transcriptional regulator [Burkholderiaceae bacterium]
MRHLDLTSFRLFIAVCEKRSIAAAAQQHSIAASAVSKRLSLLREAAGVPLLERSKGGMRATLAGEAMLEHARTLLSTVEALEQDMAACGAGISGRVRIALSSGSVSSWLFEAVASFMRKEEHRSIQVDIEEMLSRDVVRQVRDGSAAIGVCRADADHEGLDTWVFHSDHLALVTPADHPLADRSECTLEESFDYDHVGLPPPRAVRVLVGQVATTAGRSIRYKAVLSNVDSVLRAVLAGLGVAVLPSEMAIPFECAFGLRVIPLSDAWARRDFVMCRSPLLPPSPAARLLVAHLEDPANRS